MKPVRDEVVRQLVQTKKWSAETAFVAERAGYQCEYCGTAMLDTVEHYMSFEVDHIIPRFAGGADTADNLALGCHVCNSKLKLRWRPPEAAVERATREDLVRVVKDHLMLARAERMVELDQMKMITG